MALIANAFPILPGKTEAWKSFIAELNGARKEAFKKSREAVGVHERTFLQQTPMGDTVIVTLEGDNPFEAFQKFAQGQDEFTNWFVAQVQEIHGFDLRAPLPGPLPELVVDSAN